MLRSINRHYLATNTKSQPKVKYNASVCTVWSPVTSQTLLKYKFTRYKNF
jgi:hypothetical protein